MFQVLVIKLYKLETLRSFLSIMLCMPVLSAVIYISYENGKLHVNTLKWYSNPSTVPVVGENKRMGWGGGG